MGVGVTYSKCWKRKHYQARIVYLAKLSFRNESKVKTFPNKQKLKAFIIIRPAL